jgi:prepilin-type N-terminal cleavage/methylation domain-containing protein
MGIVSEFLVSTFFAATVLGRKEVGDQMGRLNRVRRRAGADGVGGFTLVEVIVALAVVGVGVTVVLSLYTNSLAINRSNRNHSIAAALAEEQLAHLRCNPGGYDWAGVLESEEGALAELKLKPMEGGAATQGFKAPAVVPDGAPGSAPERQLYEDFTWQAYVRSAARETPYIEVIMVVRWREAQRPREFALASYVPRVSLEGVL